MSEKLNKPRACPVPGRLIRNETKTTIHVSSEHKLEPDQVAQAIEIAEVIDSLTQPIVIHQAVLDSLQKYGLDLVALENVFSKLVIAGITAEVGNFSYRDKVHKVILDAAKTCAGVTAENCNLKVSFAIDHETLDEYFFNDWTHKSQLQLTSGKRVVAHCVAPKLGKKWVQAATDAILMYDPTIKPKFTTHEAKA